MLKVVVNRLLCVLLGRVGSLDPLAIRSSKIHLPGIGSSPDRNSPVLTSVPGRHGVTFG